MCPHHSSHCISHANLALQCEFERRYLPRHVRHASYCAMIAESSTDRIFITVFLVACSMFQTVYETIGAQASRYRKFCCPCSLCSHRPIPTILSSSQLPCSCCAILSSTIASPPSGRANLRCDYVNLPYPMFTINFLYTVHTLGHVQPILLQDAAAQGCK